MSTGFNYEIYSLKCQQNEWYLEKKKKDIMRDNIVDYNVMHIMTRRIMNSML